MLKRDKVFVGYFLRAADASDTRCSAAVSGIEIFDTFTLACVLTIDWHDNAGAQKRHNYAYSLRFTKNFCRVFHFANHDAR